jgi:Bacterial regulatory helix-turn-helix protein, lysR family
MDVVAAMQVFVRVAEAGGFTSVARETRTTQPRVSRIAALEDDLGARLFHRSTAVSLTEFERDPLLSDRGAGHAGLNNFRSFADALD